MPPSAQSVPGVGSLYIHWPYCQAKCPYCDFNVHLTQSPIDEEAWVQALLADLAWQLEEQDCAPLETIYFGGGTPSLLSPKAVGRILTGVAELWGPSPTCQISLEVHPTSVDTAKYAGFAAAGITRVSIGVQSFHADALMFLGRDHSPEEARGAVATAQQTFDKVSLDLMTALPGFDLSHQRADIAQALDLGVGHVSVYQLGVEPGTAFGAAVRQGEWQPMEADTAAEFFNDAAQQLTTAGLRHYEVSNFARPGHESLHSLAGWHGQAYVGIGPGAEGRAWMRDGTWRQRITRKSPSGYLRQVAERGHGLEADVALDSKERYLEQLIFGLRMSEGLPLASPAWQIASPERLTRLRDHGDLAESATHRFATAQGRLRLDAINDYLINHVR